MSRYGSYIYQVHIADGFADDCEELIHRCSKKEPLTYLAFCSIWKEMNFASIYCERTTGSEIVELSEELLHIGKHYMVADTSNYEETVAGVFLVYALLNLQPYVGFAALRVVPGDMMAINRIEMVARRDNRYDVLYILGSILISGPCQFHAAERERGMEPPLRKYLEGYTGIDKQGVRPKGVFYRQNEELDMIRELNTLSRRYTEAKATIKGEDNREDPSLNYADQNLATELETSLKKIINGLIEDEGEKSSPEDHYNSVQAIKAKAMKNTVNPMKHLTGVSERPSTSGSPTKRTEIRSRHGKVITGSPSKPTRSPRQRKPASPKRGKTKRSNAKRKRKVVSSSSDSDSDDMGPIVDDDSDRDISLEEDDDPNDETNKEKTDETNHALHIDIKSLPVRILTERETEYMRIELLNENQLDKTKDRNEDLESKLIFLKDLSICKVDGGECSRTNEDIPPPMADISKVPGIIDNHIFKKPRSELKKTLVKSKFKRMGMLHVAFNEDTK